MARAAGRERSATAPSRGRAHAIGAVVPVDPTAAPRPAVWDARLRLGLEARAGRTVLAQRLQRGPLAVQRAFYPEGAPCHLYLLHPPGGVVGGDRLRIEAEVAPGAHALLTTPGAAKLYRSAGPEAELTQSLRVADGGILEWLPQETICFPGARARLRTRIELAGDARFIGWDLLSLGRPVIDERFDQGRLDQGLEIHRDGRPLLLERLRIADGNGLDGPAGLRGLPVLGALLAAPATAAELSAVQALLAAQPKPIAGCTLLDELLVVRILAERCEPAMNLMRACWQVLRPGLLGRPPSAPRVWAT